MIRLPLKSFQARVAGWMQQCFGAAIAADVRERGDRFLEEALELLQSHGYDPARVARLRDYVWSRPIGEPAQEVGGVMVTLAAYCTATSIDLDAAGEAELARILSPEVVERIQQKQETKRDIHSPLPSADPACSCPSGDGSLRWPCPAHLLTADRTAIRLLVAAGHVTEGKANEALNIAHGFDKGPLAQAQGAGEVVAGTSKATLHRDRAGCEWFIVTSDESPDDESEVTPSDDPALFAFLKAVTAPPSAPVGVNDLFVLLRRCEGAVRRLGWKGDDYSLGHENRMLAQSYENGAFQSARETLHALAQQPELKPFVGVVCPECNAEYVASAQQPAADDSTDYRCPDCGKLNYKPLGCANCGYELPNDAQQPAAVDWAMVERACAAGAEQAGESWPLDAADKTEKLREHMRAILTAALAAQPQGASHDQ